MLATQSHKIDKSNSTKLFDYWPVVSDSNKKVNVTLQTDYIIWIMVFSLCVPVNAVDSINHCSHRPEHTVYLMTDLLR